MNASKSPSRADLVDSIDSGVVDLGIRRRLAEENHLLTSPTWSDTIEFLMRVRSTTQVVVKVPADGAVVAMHLVPASALKPWSVHCTVRVD